MLSGAEAVDMLRRARVRPNVGAKLPAEAGAVSLVRDDAPSAADQAYRDACLKGRTMALPELYGADLMQDSERMCAGSSACAPEGRRCVTEAS